MSARTIKIALTDEQWNHAEVIAAELGVEVEAFIRMVLLGAASVTFSRPVDDVIAELKNGMLSKSIST